MMRSLSFCFDPTRTPGVAVSDCIADHCPAGARGFRPDPLGFIRANMRIAPVPTLPEIRLYTAHPASGLWRLAELDEDGSGPSPPYWAYHWAGGAALARHILDRPETVTGGRVLDLGAGSGIVGIAAAKAGAREVIAAELDRYARDYALPHMREFPPFLFCSLRLRSRTWLSTYGDLKTGSFDDERRFHRNRSLALAA
jgi:hypothetical protein